MWNSNSDYINEQNPDEQFRSGCAKYIAILMICAILGACLYFADKVKKKTEQIEHIEKLKTK